VHFHSVFIDNRHYYVFIRFLYFAVYFYPLFRRPCSDFTDMLWRLTNCRIIIIIIITFIQLYTQLQRYSWVVEGLLPPMGTIGRRQHLNPFPSQMGYRAKFGRPCSNGTNPL